MFFVVIQPPSRSDTEEILHPVLLHASHLLNHHQGINKAAATASFLHCLCINKQTWKKHATQPRQDKGRLCCSWQIRKITLVTFHPADSARVCGSRDLNSTLYPQSSWKPVIYLKFPFSSSVFGWHPSEQLRLSNIKSFQRVLATFIAIISISELASIKRDFLYDLTKNK